MTISAVSSFSASSISSYQKDRQAFGQLVSGLQSGDLTAAQAAYNTLASSPMAQGNGPFAQAIQQIGKDLQSGDLADAQKALASLQQQQQARGHHRHHHGGGSVSGTSDSSQATSSTNAGDCTETADSTDITVQITAASDSTKIDIKA